MDITSYLKRINYYGSLAPTTETLRALHQAHVLAVPFENLDIHLGQPILLDEEHLFDKMVTRRRGGFCLELNGLFAALLRKVGFSVTLLAANVGDPQGPEFDHLALLVQLEELWLADVSFGDRFIEPLRLNEPGKQVQRSGVCRRLHQNREGMVLEWSQVGQWVDAYRFTLQPRRLSDFTEVCYYLQTSPRSLFTQKRICYRATPKGQILLRDMQLAITNNGQRHTEELAGQDEYGAVLKKYFEIELYQTNHINK
jgi:N-hydroxyarylamine O-acetyltransferase